MADNKRNLQQKNEQLIKELETLKKSSGMSAEQRHQLETRIEALQDEMLTKEELSKKEQAKLQKTHQKEIENLSSERDLWQSRYTSETIVRSITDASVSNDAINPSQIVAILQSKTTLQPVLDAEGNDTGRLAPKVKFDTTDKDGKPVTLDISPVEAVKQMKDMDEYFNLFKGEGTGGLGASTRASGKSIDIKNVAKDPAKYRELRKAGKI